MNPLLRSLWLAALLLPMVVLPASGGELIELGGRQLGNDYGLLGCVKCIEEGKAAVLFGMIVKPKSTRLTYAIIIKSNNKDGVKVEAVEGKTKGENTEGTLKLTCADGAKIDGVPLMLKYTASLDTDSEGTSEKLDLAGVRVDFSRGRVFLVDMTQKKPSVRQILMDLPSGIPDLSSKKHNSKEAISKAAQQIVRTLADKSTTVGAYAFAAEYEAKAAKARQGYIDFLKDEGYAPKTLPNGHVLFKKEGRTYLIFVEKEDPDYFCLVFPGFMKFDEEDRDKVFRALDFANGRNKVGRVYSEGNVVSASVDFYLGTPDQYKATFNRSMNALDSAAVTFVTRIRTRDD